MQVRLRSCRPGVTNPRQPGSSLSKCSLTRAASPLHRTHCSAYCRVISQLRTCELEFRRPLSLWLYVPLSDDVLLDEDGGCTSASRIMASIVGACGTSDATAICGLQPIGREGKGRMVRERCRGDSAMWAVGSGGGKGGDDGHSAANQPPARRSEVAPSPNTLGALESMTYEQQAGRPHHCSVPLSAAFEGAFCCFRPATSHRRLAERALSAAPRPPPGPSQCARRRLSPQGAAGPAALPAPGGPIMLPRRGGARATRAPPLSGPPEVRQVIIIGGRERRRRLAEGGKMGFRQKNTTRHPTPRP